MGRSDKPARSSITGLLVVDKPVGMTSMEAVAIVRRKAAGARCGHAGTLDPLASGVLVIALGRAATRELARFMATPKQYRTVVDLSAFTTTGDREGERLEVEVAAPPPEGLVRAALARFTGEIEQRPPAASAVKVGGRRAYALARRGEDPPLPARQVVVHAIELRRYRWPELELEIRCGSGTYVRSLARDIGEALAAGGHCAWLRRMAVGPFTEGEARSPLELPERLTGEDLIPLAEALRRLEPGPPR